MEAVSLSCLSSPFTRQPADFWLPQGRADLPTSRLWFQGSDVPSEGEMSPSKTAGSQKHMGFLLPWD